MVKIPVSAAIPLPDADPPWGENGIGPGKGVDLEILLEECRIQALDLLVQPGNGACK
jgi:hypothetical protein